MATPRKIRCTVREIVDHGADVYTLRLSPERGLPPFQAGQFLHLAIDPYDPSSFWPDSRAFSIASSPSERELLEIVYSVVGRYTRRMKSELRVGSEVWVKLPYGEFVVDPGSAEDIVLIGGGTGVSPFVPFLRAFAAGERSTPGSRLHLLYGAREVKLLIYKDEFERAAGRNASIRLLLFAEQGAGAGIESGRLSVEKAIESVIRAGGAPRSAVYYLSGPPGLIRSFSEELKVRGVPADQVRVDAWE